MIMSPSFIDLEAGVVMINSNLMVLAFLRLSAEAAASLFFA
jgi:hypothetical protein